MNREKVSVNLESVREQFYERVYKSVRELESVLEYFRIKVHVNQHEHRKSAGEHIITEDFPNFENLMRLTLERK